MNKSELQTLELLGAYSTCRLIKGERWTDVVVDALWMNYKAKVHAKRAFAEAKKNKNRSLASSAMAVTSDVKAVRRSKRALKVGVFIGKQLKVF